MAKRTLFFSASLALFVLAGSAEAAFISGVTIESVSSEVTVGFDRAAVHAVDGSGLVAGAHTSYVEGTMWDADTFGFTPDGPDTAPAITFDLGAEYVVNGMHVWNYNAFGFSERSVHELTILASIDGTSFVSLGDFILSQAPGADEYLGEAIDLAEVSARYIRFDIHSNYSNSGLEFGVGLSEVAFDAFDEVNPVPEPSSLALLTIGGLIGGVRYARRKRGHG